MSQKGLCSFFKAALPEFVFHDCFSTDHFLTFHRKTTTKGMVSLLSAAIPTALLSDTPFQVLLGFPAAVKSAQEQAQNKLWFMPLPPLHPGQSHRCQESLSKGWFQDFKTPKTMSETHRRCLSLRRTTRCVNNRSSLILHSEGPTHSRL